MTTLSRSIQLLAIVVGLGGTLLSLMALGGPFLENPWAQLGVTVVLGLVAPAIIAERLGRDHRGELRPERVLNTLSVAWLGFAVLVIAVASPWTHGLFVNEAARLTEAGAQRLGGVFTWVARGDPDRTLGSRTARVSPRAPSPSESAVTTKAAPPPTRSEVSDPPKPPPSVSPRDLPRLTDTEIRGAVGPSICSLSVRLTDGSVRMGSCFAVSRDRVATASWLIDDATTAALRFGRGTWVSRLDVVATSPEEGIAILALEQPLEPAPVVFQDPVTLAPGDPIMGLSDTLGFGVTERRTTLADPGQPTAPGWSDDLEIRPTDVGGPVVSDRGAVVGIVVRKAQSPLGVASSTSLRALMVQTRARRPLHGEGIQPAPRW